MIYVKSFLIFFIKLSKHVKNKQIIKFHLKAYSLISYRGRSQKIQTLNFLHLFVAFLQEGHFPKGI